MKYIPVRHDLTEFEPSKKARSPPGRIAATRLYYKYQDTGTLSMVRSICEALDCNPGDLMTAGKVECIPAKKESPDAK